MLLFFGEVTTKVFVVQSSINLSNENLNKLKWLFGDVPHIKSKKIEGPFVGPRASMITPWSTNAVEITQNMGVKGILRIEEYLPKSFVKTIDPMLVVEFEKLAIRVFLRLQLRIPLLGFHRFQPSRR